MLDVEEQGKRNIVSFAAGGLAFIVHNPKVFVNEIVPNYFQQKKYSSFKRQLRTYGFELISGGPFRGCYFHELFRRDSPELSARIRVASKIPQAQKPKGKKPSFDELLEREWQEI